MEMHGFELAFILGAVMSLIALFTVAFSRSSSAQANGKVSLDKAGA